MCNPLGFKGDAAIEFSRQDERGVSDGKDTFCRGSDHGRAALDGGRFACCRAVQCVWDEQRHAVASAQVKPLI